MRRDEALTLREKPVTAWTATNGEYIGILERLIIEYRKPWRGKVRIKAVLDPPIDIFGGPHAHPRFAFVYDALIEVGGTNIKPYDGDIPDYAASLRAGLNRNIHAIESGQRDWPWRQQVLDGLHRELENLESREMAKLAARNQA